MLDGQDIADDRRQDCRVWQCEVGIFSILEDPKPNEATRSRNFDAYLPFTNISSTSISVSIVTLYAHCSQLIVTIAIAFYVFAGLTSATRPYGAPSLSQMADTDTSVSQDEDMSSTKNPKTRENHSCSILPLPVLVCE